MFNTRAEPWSNNPNAPKISHRLYMEEKSWFAGHLMASMLYGMLVVLFFKCMAALFNPAYRKGEGIRWGLVSFTVLMFSLETVVTSMSLNNLSISYIDNREFPGVERVPSPGPLAYQVTHYFHVTNVIPNFFAVLNSWLADGLLLYRCYIFYSRNIWVIAFPCLMYLSSMVMGILVSCPTTERVMYSSWPNLAFYSISLSLNIILTLMIVIRLILYGRNTFAAPGSLSGFGRLYKTIATMLIESCALFAVSSLLLIVPWAVENPTAFLFSPIFAEIQVIAPLLIVLRVANRSSLTSDSIAPGTTTSFRFRSRGELTGGSQTLPSGHPAGFMVGHRASSSELMVDT